MNVNLISPSNTPLPVWLWLDPTTRCNLSCKLCYTKESHGKLDLDPEDLRGALSRMAASPDIEVKTIHLNWRGEPLMNGRFSELLAVVQETLPDVYLQWHTNGTLLTKKRVQQILDVGYKHKIFVSIDGGNEHSHDANRGVGTFRRSITGLRNLLANDARHDLVEVGLYQIDLGEPLEAYDPDFVELSGMVDDYVKVKPLLPGGAEHEIDELSSLDTDADLNRMMAEELNPKIPVPHGPCFWAGHVLCMGPTGDVWVCIVSHGAQGVVGNMFSEPPELVLQRARAFRARLIEEGRHAILHCSSCRKPEGKIAAKHLKAKVA